MTAALVEMRAGMPPHTAFGDIRADATWWADLATPAELMEHFGAALRKLGRTALCLQHRKALMVEIWNALSAQDQEAFLRRVAPGGEARRSGEAS
uniref:Uncharacterized protein n=1 Tax=Cereibacter sphaeroides (strain ATCC 17025 / ATH 2.4.3) TaxID=349102 RepID=A4WS86_CERS5